MRNAYVRSTFIPGVQDWVSLEFRSKDMACAFITLWFQFREKTPIAKARAVLLNP